jgi:hypothetical protein
MAGGSILMNGSILMSCGDQLSVLVVGVSCVVARASVWASPVARKAGGGPAMVPMSSVAARLSMLTQAGTSVASVGDELVDPRAQLLAGVADFADHFGQRLRTTRRCHHRYVAARRLT